MDLDNVPESDNFDEGSDEPEDRRMLSESESDQDEEDEDEDEEDQDEAQNQDEA